MADGATPPGAAERAFFAGLIGAILLVIALSVVAGPTMVSTESGTRLSIIQRDLGLLKAATIRFRQRVGRLPRSLDELVPADLADLPRDPYGRSYVLRANGENKVYLWSLGADGVLARYPPDIAAVVDLGEE